MNSKVQNYNNECRKTQEENEFPANMRAAQASKYLACGKSTLWLWVKQGKIKAYKLSDKVTIFKKKELDAFIDQAAEVVS